jgi:predicted transcriptional regulator
MFKSTGNLEKKSAEVVKRSQTVDAKGNTRHWKIIDKLIKDIKSCPESCRHDLVIFESGSEIYAYVTTGECLERLKRLNSLPIDDISRKCIDNTPISKSSFDLNTFKNGLLKDIKENNEKGVKNRGIKLGLELIPKNIQAKLKEELQNDDNKIKNVWIFCEEKDIDYLWEWIYCKEKDFFWGKKFHMCRIPNGKISKGGLKPQNIEIKQRVFIQGNACQCGNKDKKCFNPEGDGLQGALNNIRNLNSVDCMHFVANINIYQENKDIYESCEDKLQKLKCLFTLDTDYAKYLETNDRSVHTKINDEFEKYADRLSGEAEKTRSEKEKHWVITDGKKKYLVEDTQEELKVYDQNYKLKFLFLNIRIPENVNNYEKMIKSANYELRLLKLKDLFTRSAEIWIDTNLDLPDNLALNFSNDFYSELKNGRKTVPEVLTEARKMGNELCRLAYVVKGNPSTTVSWTAS